MSRDHTTIIYGNKKIKQKIKTDPELRDLVGRIVDYLNGKSNLTPDPVRDPPVGKYQCPGGHMVLPARAYGDTRFNQYPMTFRCFAICCAHANS